jgi:hypothetical protein
MTLQLSLLEIETKANMPSKSSPVASKDIKTMNNATQHQTIAKINKISRTRWTDEQWRHEYWGNTNEHPKELVRRALERGDGKTELLLDHILTGYHRDNRKRNGRRTEEDLIADGNWYLLCELAKMMREGKR